MTATIDIAESLKMYLADNRPIGWNDMGSSERDLCEERMTRDFHHIMSTVGYAKVSK